MKKLGIIGIAVAVVLLTSLPSMAADKDKEKDKGPPPLKDPTQTECTLPFKPSVAIAGATTTTEEINALADRIRAYQGELNKYRACLEPLMTKAKRAGNKARMNELDEIYNASVNDEWSVVAGYNAVRAAFDNHLSSDQQAAFSSCYLKHLALADERDIYGRCLKDVKRSSAH